MTGLVGDQAQQRLLGGRYLLYQVVGRGGMGVVWAAKDELLGRPVAVKEVLPPPSISAAELDDLRRRTLVEARAAARISSPAAMTVYDVVEENGHPWIVMELLAPRTLADVLKERPLSPPEAAALGLTLLSALTAAQSAGVLHRDVKPANVMFRGPGDDVSRAVLTDFGIARFVGDPNVTATGTLVGSPAYVAPERATGRPATFASDLWSLGVTLWTAVEGRAPFEREGALPTLAAVVTEPVPTPWHAGPLAPVLEGLLQKDPEHRTGADELRLQLQAVAAGTAAREDVSRTAVLTTVAPLVPAPAPPRAAASRPVGHDPHDERERRGSRGVGGVLVGLALVAAIAVALVLLFDPFGSGDPDVVADPGSTSSPSGSTSAAPGAGSDPGATSPAAEPDTTGSDTTGPDANGPDATTEAPAPTDPAAGPAVPEGFELHEDPTGFAVAVPGGWTVERPSASAVRFDDPRSGASLLVDQTDDPKDDPVADWRAQEQVVSGNFTDYQRVGEIEGFELRGWSGADWEFTYATRDGRGHKLNRNLVTAPGEQAYALLWTTSDEQWTQRRDDFDAVFESFRPRNPG